ncbi:MAG UNVERIFIED_CONTAM: hypothetical protein LVR18_30610 [Planctomycetaceae bacterium]
MSPGFPPRPLVPSIYVDLKSTPLTLEVTSDPAKNTIVFELQGELPEAPAAPAGGPGGSGPPGGGAPGGPPNSGPPSAAPAGGDAPPAGDPRQPLRKPLLNRRNQSPNKPASSGNPACSGC